MNNPSNKLIDAWETLSIEAGRNLTTEEMAQSAVDFMLVSLCILTMEEVEEIILMSRRAMKGPDDDTNG